MPDQATAAVPLCVTQAEAAEMLRVSPRHFRRMVKAGKVRKLTHLGPQMVRYSVDELRAFVNQTEKQG